VQLQERHDARDERERAEPARVHLVHLALLQVELEDGDERLEHGPVGEVAADERDGVEAVALVDRDVKLEAVRHDDELGDRHLGARHDLRRRAASGATMQWRIDAHE
jgi:hypothetical protein